MNIEKKLLKEILTEKKLLTLAQYKKYSKQVAKNKQTLEEILIEKNIVDEEHLAQLYSQKVDIPYVDLTKRIIRRDILFQIPQQIAKKNNVVAFAEEAGILKIAMADPEDLQIIEFIKKKIGQKIKVYLTSVSSINNVVKQYRKGLKEEFDKMIDESVSAAQGEYDDLKKMAENMPVVRIVDMLLEHAMLQGVSDIHIEPMEKRVVVRYRVDGILHDVIILPREILAAIVARIKILSNLKIDEHRLPQDGRFKMEKDGHKISLRVSILPVYDGEKVVMRLLMEDTRVMTLEELGLQYSALQTSRRNINRPHGLILVTGPTGSGKTTSLYAMLSILNKPEVNISTIEDPIEYHIPRINQSQVKPKIGYKFSTGLRSLVRQDPDIIMVGEIRDEETVNIAINSALTGHLVLSTLHTRNAAGAAPRLMDMGAEPFLIASTLNIIIAQRLVRKNCTNCLEEYQLNNEQIKLLEKEYDIPAILNVLVREKIIKQIRSLAELKFYRSKGCEYCNNMGYKGRIGVFEAMEITEAIKQLILNRASIEEIQRKAVKQGMITLVEDGFIKAITGITSIDEVTRVTMN